MTTTPMRLTVPTLIDGLMLLPACKTALLVLQLPAGASPGFEVFAWYGLAALYAGCVWVCSARRTAAPAEVFARAFLLFGALLSGCLLRHFGESAQASPVQSLDWLVLGVCLGCGAVLHRPSRDE